DFSWARNNGGGQFTIFPITNPATGGDFLQGASVGQVIAGGEVEVVLSWHAGSASTWMFTVPADPTTAAWPLAAISPTTNQEQVPIGDVDGDGDVDVHLGSSWLRQEAGGTFSTQPGVPLGGDPDRVVLADIDGDTDLDVVIGIEFGDRLVWGESTNDGADWTEHLIATDIDYFSVDAADIDGDGDVDVVGGDHMGDGAVFIYENDGLGSSWVTHTVDPGDSNVIDHHDGTRLVDMDLDGDLDIISIGWSLRSLVIYENLAIDSGGGDVVPPVIQSVVALGDPNQVTVDFSEPLDQTTAESAANYAISDGVVVSDASLGANQRTVRLTTSLLAEGIGYTLTVNDVEYVAGNPILPDSTAAFVFIDVDPAAGLVAHWPLDEGIGTSTIDASGNGHTGVLVNGPEWTSGPALDFDGADDYVDVGTFDVPGSALTLAAWILPQDLANCSANDCRILAKSTGTAESAHYFMLSTIDSGGPTRLRFRLKTGGVTSTLIASSGDLVEGQWAHAAAVYDGAEMILYLDGSPVGSTGKSGALSLDDTVPVWIGGSPGGASEKPWDGILDDVRIYDRALSEAEIQSLPGQSQGAIFSDGFESGDLSAWSASVP
ncbi:MAG: FG-GAP-like repeat-containing protein, partial [Acidobacteria bacterium]|nr:FG-GAP-like repeat-containing protein [Acidobacteriota bacterium]